MLQNAYLVANFGFDTAGNEPCKVCPVPRKVAPRRSLQSIGFHGLTALSFLAYYLGATTDPGGIPDNDTWRCAAPAG